VEKALAGLNIKTGYQANSFVKVSVCWGFASLKMSSIGQSLLNAWNIFRIL
jgi:hypothetical protein